MGKINASIYKFALLLGVLLAYVIVNNVHFSTTIDTPNESATIAYDSTPGKNIFNPDATLDTSQVIESQPPVILPTDTDTVTRTILFEGTYVPEFAPDGGTPDGWLDNSPTYSDGWMLLVNDSTHTTYWRLIPETDAECADYSRSIGEEPQGYAEGK